MCKSSVDYLELISLSTKGDKQALEALFAHAEKLSSMNKHEEATKAFKDSAVSYRISAYRNLNLAEEAKVEVNRLSHEIKLLKDLIGANSPKLRPLPRMLDGLTKQFVWETVDYAIANESLINEQLQSLISLLNSTLDEIHCNNNTLENIDHYGGATIPSRLTYLMEDYFGLGDSPFGSDLENINVRSLADLLAAEIEKRFYATKKA
jgi:hypothetical protein